MFSSKYENTKRNLDESYSYSPEMVKVSVVVPVFNTEKYLVECLDSLLDQSLTEIEVICVDDGSTDGSLDILRQYEKKDARVRVICQENQGQGKARNTGAQHAIGQYLYFVDSDDWLDKRAIELMYLQSSKMQSDLCFCGLLRYDQQTKKILENKYYSVDKYKLAQKEVFNYKDIKDGLFEKFGPSFKFYKTDFYRSKNLHFEEGVHYEDVGAHVAAVLAAERMTYIDDSVYYYRINRPGSTMTEKMNLKKIDDVSVYLKTVHSLLKEKGVLEELKEFYLRFVVEQVQFHQKRFAEVQDYFYGSLKDYFKMLSNDCIEANQQLKSLNSEISRPKMSVVIAVYNTQQYLRECIGSLQKQTLKDLEIVCVDDGSTDGSLSLLKEFAKEDSRIKVLEGEHNKLGAARNKALKVITGRYCQFLDSDDYLEPEACEELYNRMQLEQLDMLQFSGVNFDHITRVETPNSYWSFKWLPKHLEGKIFDRNSCLSFLPSIAVSSCLTIYRTDFIRNNNISFPEGIFFEDNIFFTKAISLMNRIGFDRRKFYHRRIHPESVTQNRSKNFGDEIVMVDMLLDLVWKQFKDEKLLNIYKKDRLSQIEKHLMVLSHEEAEKHKPKVRHIFSKWGYKSSSLIEKNGRFSFFGVPYYRHSSPTLERISFGKLIAFEKLCESKMEHIKICGIKLIKTQILADSKKRVKILGLPVYSCVNANGTKTRRILFIKWSVRDKNFQLNQRLNLLIQKSKQNEEKLNQLLQMVCSMKKRDEEV